MKKIFAFLALLIFASMSFGQATVTVAKTVHDTSQVLRTGYKQTSQDTARKVVHDSLTVRVPQAIDTAATPRFHSVTIAYTGTGSTTALLATGNCPCHTGTAPNKWMGIIFINGDTLWTPGWK